MARLGEQVTQESYFEFCALFLKAKESKRVLQGAIVEIKPHQPRGSPSAGRQRRVAANGRLSAAHA